ncbi:26S proteasome subunit P45 family protein [Ancylostoma caninum]|uniref:26S proteasome subunit P45 family protein n=2 Tax=Ancylostoma TaxID=29169 RepID=A0A368GTY1_ANCCA|nr:26S proteasome subunit P45 family protein [Ancylostoma caninum]
MGNRLGGVQRKREKPEHAAMKVSMKRVKGLEHVNKLPNIIPRRQCLLRLLKQNRVHDYLLLEMEFIKRQNSFKSLESQKKEERKVVQQLRGTPTTLAKVHELFNDEQHAVVVVEGSKREWFIPILSIVDKDLLHLNALVMVKASGMFKNVPTAIVGVLPDTTDSSALGHKLDKPPKETFEDIGGLESPIQEMKESVELPLTHPEYYEEMGITAPKGVILYGEPGTGKTLLAKAVANSTAATFIRATGADLVQKNSGDGAKLVRELFKMAKDNAPSIVFLDEIDAVGTKRYDTSSRGEQEVQRTLLELLNQLDGFESRGDVKVILATNRIDSLDSALLRPGRIDRKIELPKPDDKTRQKIFSVIYSADYVSCMSLTAYSFQIHTSGMNLAKDVSFDAVMAKEKTMSGAEIKAVCTEAGMLALRAQRKVVCADDFEKAIKNVMLKNKGGAPEEIYS